MPNLSDLIYEVGELGLRNVRLESDYIRFINRAIKRIATRRNWSFLHDRIQATIAANTTSVPLPANFKCLAPELSPITVNNDCGGLSRPVTVLTRAEIERHHVHEWHNRHSGRHLAVFLEMNVSGESNATTLAPLVVIDSNGTVMQVIVVGGVIGTRPLPVGSVPAPGQNPLVITDPSTGLLMQVVVIGGAVATQPYAGSGGVASGPFWSLNLPHEITEPLTFNLSCFTFPVDLVLGGDNNAITNHGELADGVVNLAKSLCYFAEDPSDQRGVAAQALYERAYKTACYEDARALLGGMSARM
jgi:hypothetical protein